MNRLLPTSGPRAWYGELLFAMVCLILVGAFAARSGLLSVDGRYTYWNHAAVCIQAYGLDNVDGCDAEGQVRP